MAHTKAKGTSKLGRDSQAKRLGVKIFGGQKIKKGQIIIRQRGTKFRSGAGTELGKDYTIFAVIDGVVKFTKKKVKKFDGNLETCQVVTVEIAKTK